MADEPAPHSHYSDHLETYQTILNISKILVVAVATILVCLIVFSYGGTFGSVVGTILVILSIATSLGGLAARQGGWIAPGVVFILSGLAALYATA